ncbi:Colicin V production protein [Sporobacter termitidis DSM 10068]|uniref:Colicin V production protein n=1 Tax=Sporobacter termitidis DSM 10068 TaxID=1123282 RepID=A0A1M5ZEX5_9FIRM|nr:CvpA family protein [Sporobacter termitidis]SHI22790.1 Colicin V production protein [Sporobacter termitidis DSM 10068]
MNWAIDGVLILIVAFCAWRGLRNGFIRGVFGVLAIIVAIYGANLVASAYSSEFTGMLEPFVGGIVDKAVTRVVTPDDDVVNPDAAPADDGEKNPDAALTDDEKTDVFDVSFAALRDIGVATGASKLIAEKVGGQVQAVGQPMSVYLTEKLCDALAYIGVFLIAFVLITIIFAVIGNIFNLAFSLPGIASVDKIVGLVLGILKGLLIVLVLAVVVRYVGLVSADTVEKTTVLSFLLNRNPLAGILGL